MRKLVVVMGLSLLILPVFGQPTSKYQVATILDVTPHRESGVPYFSDSPSYDVSVKVGDTIYVALYTPRVGEIDAKYVAGRDLLVEVGKTSITYNDIMGHSYEVPIESQRPASVSKEVSK